MLRRRRLGGFLFRRQHPIGPWIVDFVCIEAQLIIEIDGGYHQGRATADLRREEELIDRGFSILRYMNQEVTQNTEDVRRSILAALGQPSGTPPSQPSPAGAGEGGCITNESGAFADREFDPGSG